MTDLSGVWRYDTSEVIAAPAPGYIRTGPAPVSRLAISAQTRGGADVLADLLRIGNGAELLAQEVSDATLAVRYGVTAAPTDHVTWVEYQVVPLAATATGPPTKNTDILVNGWAAAGHPAYATRDEFVRQLRLDNPTPDALEAADRALAAATAEIDRYLGWTDASGYGSLTGEQQQLVVTVNLDRAGEHWKFLPYGVMNQGPETVPVLTAKNSWYRHAQKLLPLKHSWGIG